MSVFLKIRLSSLLAFCVAAAFMLVLPSCVQHQSPALVPGVFLQSCQEDDAPAMLLRKVRVVGHHATDDLDPVYHVLCRVCLSHKLEPKAGDEVLLSVPSGPWNDESGPAERTHYWLVFGKEGDMDWMPRKSRRHGYTASALDFHGCDAEQELLPLRHELQGVWKEMADMVAKKK